MEKQTETIIVKYSIADAEIAKLSDQYLNLFISDSKDKNAYEIVHAARMDIRAKRCEVESKRKELKASALEYGRAVDSEAKRLTALLEPIENHLDNEERIFTEEVERVKKDKEKVAAEKLQKRIDSMQSFGAHVDLFKMKNMSDEEFAAVINDAKTAFDAAESKRKADKDAADKLEKEQSEERARIANQMAAERERMAKEKAEADKIAREANAAREAAEKATRDAQEAERAAIAKLQAEKDKAIAVEKARLDAEAKAKADEEELVDVEKPKDEKKKKPLEMQMEMDEDKKDGKPSSRLESDDSHQSE